MIPVSAPTMYQLPSWSVLHFQLNDESEKLPQASGDFQTGDGWDGPRTLCLIKKQRNDERNINMRMNWASNVTLWSNWITHVLIERQEYKVKC